jgi:ABC-type lipoprotein export system ATPase subunit
MTAIEFQGVSKSYADRAVVDSLSFRIEEGERVVVHGPSGCGKTTVLRLIAGFLAPDIGRVLVGGDVVASDGALLTSPEHRHLGMVFKDLALWPHLTVAENLDFALKAQRLAGEVRRQRITDMLARVHLDEWAEAYPARLSGGQQQRVAIARALVAAEFVFLPADTNWAGLKDGVVYDVPGCELGHHGEDVSFDAILKNYGLGDPALALLAQIVRAADSHPTNPHSPAPLSVPACRSGIDAEQPARKPSQR